MRIRRSCVTPKLVSNGRRRRIRISRNSMREINIGGASDEDVFAPVSLSFKRDHEEIIGEVTHEFLTNSQPGLLCANDVCGNADSTLLAFHRRAWPVEPPLGN